MGALEGQSKTEVFQDTWIVAETFALAHVLESIFKYTVGRTLPVTWGSAAGGGLALSGHWGRTRPHPGDGRACATHLQRRSAAWPVGRGFEGTTDDADGAGDDGGSAAARGTP